MYLYNNETSKKNLVLSFPNTAHATCVRVYVRAYIRAFAVTYTHIA